MQKQLTGVVNPPYLTLGVQANKERYEQDLHWKCSQWTLKENCKSYSIIYHKLTASPNIPKHIQEGTVMIAVFTTLNEGEYQAVN